MNPTFRETTWKGLAGVELATPAFELFVTTDFGPRIARLNLPGGENLLFWDDEAKLGRGDWKLRGGHRLWFGRPEADEAEETYAADNGKCKAEAHGHTLTVWGATDEALQIRKGLTIRLLEPDLVEVTHRVTNVGPMLASGLIWPLTCTKPAPGTRYVIPLGDGHAWDSFSMVHFRKWAGHGLGSYADDQFILHDDYLELAPKGRENKRMLQSRKGLFAMDDPARSAIFVKQVGYEPDRNHPLGCNLAAYVGTDNFMVEMESMGPVTSLRPGETMLWTETWMLAPRKVGLTSADLLKMMPS